MIPARTGASNWPVRAAALTGALAYASCFYPGVMSFDAAYAWWQVRGGETSDLQAPMMMRLWQLCDALLPGPGLLFLLHLGLFWCGLALIAMRLDAGVPARLAFILVAACAPVSFMLFTHVWTDVSLMAAMTFAVGAVLRFRDAGHGGWLWAAALALLYALGVRFNAVLAVLPIASYAVFLLLRRRWPDVRRSPARIAACTALSLLVLGIPVTVINRLVERHIPYGPFLELCDLAAISVAADEMLIPAFALVPATKTEFFRDAYQVWACLPMYAGTRAPVAAWTSAELGELRDAWIAAILKHPGAYLHHRARFAAALIGARDPQWPHEIAFVDINYQYRDNPPVPENATAARAFLLRWFHAEWFTFWFATWPYLLLAVSILLLSWLLRRGVDVHAAVALESSAVLYALPYFFISTSAELRYLGWSCLATLIGAALLWAAPREHPRERAISSAAYPPAP